MNIFYADRWMDWDGVGEFLLELKMERKAGIIQFNDGYKLFISHQDLTPERIQAPKFPRYEHVQV